MKAYAWCVLALVAHGCELIDPDPGPEPVGPGASTPSGGAPSGGTPSGGTPSGGSPGDPADPLLGEDLFLQYCAVCHGADGSGAATYPGSIQGRTDILYIVQDGRGEMPGFPQLSAADVLAIEAFLASFVDPAQPPTGGDLYARECAGCHGAEGEGGDRGPQIRHPVRPYATWIVRNGREGRGYPDEMPDFDEDQVDDTALEEILDRLSSGPKPADGQGLYVMFCGNCHGPTGGGGPVGEGVRGDDLGELREVVRRGKGGSNYGRRGDYMPRWSTEELTDAELARIATFLGAGRGEDDD